MVRNADTNQFLEKKYKSDLMLHNRIMHKHETSFTAFSNCQDNDQSGHCKRISETGKGCRAYSPSLFARSCPMLLFPISETQKTSCWKKILNAKKSRFGYIYIPPRNVYKTHLKM
jgi:hypothetical protein